MPSDLHALLTEARLLVCSQEQALLRMITQRRVSRRSLEHAASCYARAAELLGEAVRELPERMEGS